MVKNGIRISLYKQNDRRLVKESYEKVHGKEMKLQPALEADFILEIVEKRQTEKKARDTLDVFKSDIIRKRTKTSQPTFANAPSIADLVGPSMGQR